MCKSLQLITPLGVAPVSWAWPSWRHAGTRAPSPAQHGGSRLLSRADRPQLPCLRCGKEENVTNSLMSLVWSLPTEKEVCGTQGNGREGTGTHDCSRGQGGFWAEQGLAQVSSRLLKPALRPLLPLSPPFNAPLSCSLFGGPVSSGLWQPHVPVFEGQLRFKIFPSHISSHHSLWPPGSLLS